HLVAPAGVPPPSGCDSAPRAEAVTSLLPAPPYRTGSSAQTVISPSSSDTPQRREMRSTMPRPRPPIAQPVGSDTEGEVGPPPSLTAIFIVSCWSCHPALIV